MNDNIRTARRAYSRVGLALVMILAVTMALQLLWTLIPLLIWGDEHWMVSSSWGTLLGSFLPMYLLGIPAGLVVLSTVPGEVPENNKLSAKHFWMALPITYVFVYAGSLTGNFLSTLLSGGTAENPVVEMTSYANILSVVVPVIAAPLIEEYVFRKQIIDRTAKFGEKTAVFFSALLFGLFHGNFFQFFYAFGIGLVLGYIYVRTGRLRYTIALHAIINFLGGVVAPFVTSLVDTEQMSNLSSSAAPQEIVEYYARNLPGLLVYCMYATLLLGTTVFGLVLLIKTVKKLTWKEMSHQLPAGAGGKAAYLNVGVILFFVVCTFLFLLSLV